MTLELVEFETRDERIEKALKQAIEWPGVAGWKIRNEWREALKP